MAVSRDGAHPFSKQAVDSIRLIAGEGAAGDAHRGRTVKHRSRVARDPTKPNLRQVHLIHTELPDQLNEADFDLVCQGSSKNPRLWSLKIPNLVVN